MQTCGADLEPVELELDLRWLVGVVGVVGADDTAAPTGLLGNGKALGTTPLGGGVRYWVVDEGGEETNTEFEEEVLAGGDNGDDGEIVICDWLLSWGLADTLSTVSFNWERC